MAGEPVAISALPWLWRSAAAALVVVVAGACALPPAAPMAGRRLIEVPSSLDGTKQPSYLIVPPLTRGKRVPLCVSLHTWQGDHTQRNMEMEAAAARRGWIYLFPNFRGPNDRPEACGSEAARRDILDAIAWVARRYPVDTARIYLVGVSGGGHMAMLMAGRHPERFAAISAWVGISDLAAWHATHAKGQYGAMLRRVCGGPPGANADVDRQYRERSPLTWLAGARDVPLDLAAGVHDGHTGSVPITHTLNAFNAVARARGAAEVSGDDIARLSKRGGRLSDPTPSDSAPDPEFGRSIYLRRTAGTARVTIFEGGHEMLAEAAAAWLSRHARPQRQRSEKLRLHGLRP